MQRNVANIKSMNQQKNARLEKRFRFADHSRIKDLELNWINNLKFPTKYCGKYTEMITT